MTLGSIETDLERVQQCLSIIGELGAGREHGQAIDTKIGVIERSLMTEALITYAACTGTSSTSRNSINLAKSLGTEEKKSHEAICALRNEAIAHFGPGSHDAGAWSADRLYLYSSGESGMGFAWSYNRVNYRGNVVADLDKLTTIAQDFVTSQIRETEQGIVTYIAGNQADRPLSEAIQVSKVSPIETIPDTSAGSVFAPLGSEWPSMPLT